MSAQLQENAVPVPTKLDLGCGPNKREGFYGVDGIDFKGVDLVLNLVEKAEGFRTVTAEHGGKMSVPNFKPWPWADGSIEEVHCSHTLEHFYQEERVHFFNELHRVLVKGGKALIIVPHWSSERAYGDPTHKWPPVVFFSFCYLNKEWRAKNAPHCGYECDFDSTGGNNIAPEWTVRAQETQMFAQQHYINVSHDLVVTVVKR